MGNANKNKNSEHSAPDFLIHADGKKFFSENEVKRFSKTAGDEYVTKRELDLTDEALGRMSLTDGAELCRLYKWFHTQVKPDDTDEKRAASAERLRRVGNALAARLLITDEIYCLYSKITGDPYLYSRTVLQNGNYLCSPPNIRLFTKAYLEQAEKKYPSQFFEMKCVTSGSDKKGIEIFLTERFYLDGAVGVEINGDYAAIPAASLIPPPDFSGLKDEDIPVTNPALRRWMILSAQMPEPRTNDEKTIAKLYYKMVSNEIVKARFLVPASPVTDDCDEAFVLNLESGEKYLLDTAKRTNGRTTVSVFTDTDRMPAEFGDKKALSMTVSQLCGTYDVLIDPSEKYRSGLIVTAEIFEDIKKAAGV